MKGKNAVLACFLLLIVIGSGCLSTTSSESYDFSVESGGGSNVTLIVPVVLDSDTGEPAPVMGEPRVRGNASLSFVDTERGKGIRIVTEGGTYYGYSKMYGGNLSFNRSFSTSEMPRVPIEQSFRDTKVWVYSESDSPFRFSIRLDVRDYKGRKGDTQFVRSYSVRGEADGDGWQRFPVNKSVAVFG